MYIQCGLAWSAYDSIGAQCCELLCDHDSPVKFVFMLPLCLHVCLGSERDIVTKSLNIIFAAPIESSVSTRPTIGYVYHLLGPAVAFRMMTRAIGRGFTVENVVVQGSAGGHAGREHTNAEFNTG